MGLSTNAVLCKPMKISIIPHPTPLRELQLPSASVKSPPVTSNSYQDAGAVLLSLHRIDQVAPESLGLLYHSTLRLPSWFPLQSSLKEQDLWAAIIVQPELPFLDQEHHLEVPTYP